MSGKLKLKNVSMEIRILYTFFSEFLRERKLHNLDFIGLEISHYEFTTTGKKRVRKKIVANLLHLHGYYLGSRFSKLFMLRWGHAMRTIYIKILDFHIFFEYIDIIKEI